MYSTLADTDLIYRLKHQDVKAFEAIYDRFHDCLYIHALRILEVDYLAADVLQETFISLWEFREKLDPSINLKSWLYACIRFRCIDQIRKERTRKEYINRLGSIQEGNVFSCDRHLLEKELDREIQIEIETLPKQTRKVMELKYRAGLNTREISQILASSIDTIQKQLKFAKKKLKKRFPIGVILVIIISMMVQKFRI